MPVINQVQPEKLEELRQALAEIDPSGRRDWILEIYDLRDGQERVAAILDIKTGKKYRTNHKSRGEKP